MTVSYEFLSDHATHRDTNDIQLSICRPANMINDFEEILGHF